MTALGSASSGACGGRRRRRRSGRRGGRGRGRAGSGPGQLALKGSTNNSAVKINMFNFISLHKFTNSQVDNVSDAMHFGLGDVSII